MGKTFNWVVEEIFKSNQKIWIFLENIETCGVGRNRSPMNEHLITMSQAQQLATDIQPETIQQAKKWLWKSNEFFFSGELEVKLTAECCTVSMDGATFSGRTKRHKFRNGKKRSNRPLATYLDERINQTLTDGCPVTDTDGRVSSRAEIAPSWRGPRYLTCCSAICKLLFLGFIGPGAALIWLAQCWHLTLVGVCQPQSGGGCQWTKQRNQMDALTCGQPPKP